MTEHPLTLLTNSKNDHIKKQIVSYFLEKGPSTIAEMARQTELSIPTVTKILGEMLSEELICDLGKGEEIGNRKATLFNVNPETGFFIGVDLKYKKIVITLTNFCIEIIKTETYTDFTLEDSATGFETLCSHIIEFINNLPVAKEKVLSIGMSISGRINPEKGISYSFFYDENKPLAQSLEKRFGIPVLIDNDTRSAGYAEYICGVGNGERNVIYVNVSWGLGVAIIMNKQLYYGKSGFSGEYGHSIAFENEIMCHCGKKGCLETEASGSAIFRKFMERYRAGSTTVLQEKIEKENEILLEDILDAVKKDDILSIELIESTGLILGKHLAGLLNLFNPDLLILGGTIGQIGDYIALPVKSGLMKYSLNFVNSDTELRIARLGNEAGALGACLLCRSKLLGIVTPRES